MAKLAAFQVNGYRIHPTQMRAVWAHLSTHPSANIKELCSATALRQGRVRAILSLLDQAGWVQSEFALSRARRIVVPLITLGEGARLVRRSEHRRSPPWVHEGVSLDEEIP